MKKLIKRIKFMRIKGLNKAGTAVKLFWLSAILAVISGAMALITQFFAVEHFGWTSTVHRERREIEVPDWARISISSADMPLEVYVHSGDKIIVEYIGESELIIDGDELELRIRRVEDFVFSLFSRDLLNYGMIVRLPERVYREISLTTASGNIYAENIHSELIRVTSRTGNVHLHALEGLVTVSTRQGDINLEFINFTDACSIETESGDVSVLMPERIAVRLDFFTASGLFTSDFFRREYHEHEGDLYLSTGDNSNRFTVRTSSGNLDFHKRNEIIH